MSKTIVLTNSALANLLKNQEVIRQIPQLRGPAKVLRSAKGCNCNGTKAKRRARAIQDMKMMMSNWSPEQKRALKKALGIKGAKVYVGKKMVEI